VASSAQPRQVVECHRPVAPTQVLAGGFGYQELQVAFRQDLLRVSFILQRA
jgi:hypothetical protein